jgi:hypothetical protein
MQIGKAIYVGGRIMWVDPDYIVGESRNGGWFAMAPIGAEWGISGYRYVDGEKGPLEALLTLGVRESVVL